MSPRLRRAARTSFTVVIAAVVALSASITTAQQVQPAKSWRFEVASIKPSGPKLAGESYSSSTGGPGGRFQLMNTPLKQWVKMGLSVSDYALNAPSWLDTARFDLAAKLPADLPTNRSTTAETIKTFLIEHFGLDWLDPSRDNGSAGAPPYGSPTAEMMKALLIERFGLKWHEESQVVSGYVLVPDKKVLIKPASLLERLQPPGAGWGPSSVAGTNMPISRLAELLGDALGKPVINATHLSGGYDINLSWRPPDDSEVARQKQVGILVDNLPGSAFSAVREQLGLRLQNARVPLKIIVLDNINHQPTAN